MSFQDAVRICLQRKYADFNGRARRSEYWFFILFTAIVGIVGGILDAIFGLRSGTYGGTGPIQGILQLALLVPTLAVGARRLHDIGRSGWWLLIGLIPIVGWIVSSSSSCRTASRPTSTGRTPRASGRATAPDTAGRHRPHPRRSSTEFQTFTTSPRDPVPIRASAVWHTAVLANDDPCHDLVASTLFSPSTEPPQRRLVQQSGTAQLGVVGRHWPTAPGVRNGRRHRAPRSFQFGGRCRPVCSGRRQPLTATRVVRADQWRSWSDVRPLV